MSKGTIKYLVITGVGLVIALLVSWSQGIFGAETASDVLRLVCDGFFVAGALLLAYGGLTWTSNGGVFDGLTFTFKQAFARIKRDYEEQRVTFAEHRERREAKASSPKYALLAGLTHMVIAVIIMVVYQQAAV